MKKLCFILLFFSLFFANAQAQATHESNKEMFLSLNRSILFIDEGSTFEIGCRRFFNNSGIETSFNYAFSYMVIPYDYETDFRKNDSYSINYAYLRLNYFLVPIKAGAFSFDIGGGLLYGNVSHIFVFSSVRGAFESTYDVGWYFGYNLKLKAQYNFNDVVSVGVNAGYDIFSNQYTNAHVGLTVSKRFNF